MDRKSFPGISDLINSEGLDGSVGRVVKKIKSKYKERESLVQRVDKCFAEWNRLFIELTRLDGELDALEVIALEESDKCDIISKIAEGARLANEEKADQMQSIIKKHVNGMPHASSHPGVMGGVNPFGPRRR